MSYCRWGPDSDIYLYCYNRNKQKFECCCCDLGPGLIVGLPNVIDHLNKHRQAGHKIPHHAIRRLEIELETGEWLC